jgi:predicted AlkP superfamily pyrophosphatase or phosphodiesterase
VLDAASVRAVDAARRRPGSVRPLAAGYTFAALPATIERLLGVDVADRGLPPAALGALPRSVQRVVLVLLDGFGWPFFARHADHHPLLRRMLAEGSVAKLTTQFPSTTAAHITTLHTGSPVTEHGVYEWNILDPGLDAIVTPMLFSYAGDGARDTLHRVGVAPAALYPTGPTLYRRLADRGVVSLAFQPSSFAPSTYDGVLLDGASLYPYDTQEDGLTALAGALRTQPGPTYAYVYIDSLDAVGHQHGPSSPAFASETERCLDAIGAAIGALPPGTLVLLAADHGQIDVDPARTLYVNELWPELDRHLRRGGDGRLLAPAGSARDLFLHTIPGKGDVVVAGLRALLGDRAEVCATDELVAEGLFGPRVGPRLAERIGDVCVLPGPGETAWWRLPRRFEMRFRGHHGGLTPDEAVTFVGALLVPE